MTTPSIRLPQGPAAETPEAALARVRAALAPVLADPRPLPPPVAAIAAAPPAGDFEAVAPGDSLSLARWLDHTLLRPDSHAAAIDRVCDEALRFGFATVCVTPDRLAQAAARLRGSAVRAGTVLGFPMGTQSTAIKVAEAEEALTHGAQELDMVLNLGALKDGDWARVRADIEAVARAAGAVPLKVILETVYLSDDEKRAASLVAQAAGAAFVKTSTGLAGGGATVEDIRLMRHAVGPATGVKAAGGVRDLAGARAMLAAGANRIGTSSAVAIVTAASGSAPVDSSPNRSTPDGTAQRSEY